MSEEIFNLLFSGIGQLIVAGGGGAVVALALFKFFGKSWVKHQFAKNLAEAKAEIFLLSSRRMKLHDKEYEVFPELWSRLMKARDSLTASIYSFDQLPNFSSMSKEKIAKWADRSDLDEAEKEYFLISEDKIKVFTYIQNKKRLAQANICFFEFQGYLQVNSIFLNPEIKEKLEEIAEKMHSAWVAKKVGFDGDGSTDFNGFFLTAVEVDQEEVKPLVKEIESLVQNKIFPNENKTGRGQK